MIKSDYEVNRKIGDAYLPGVKKILQDNASLFVCFVDSSFKQDTEQACDCIIEVKGGTIAIRSRRPTNYRDFTIRSESFCKKRTEYQKLIDGFGKWYIYTWGATNTKILGYAIIDLDVFRDKYILKPDAKNIKNIDGTKFHAWNVSSIPGCIIKIDKVKA